MPHTQLFRDPCVANGGLLPDYCRNGCFSFVPLLHYCQRLRRNSQCCKSALDNVPGSGFSMTASHCGIDFLACTQFLAGGLQQTEYLLAKTLAAKAPPAARFRDFLCRKLFGGPCAHAAGVPAPAFRCVGQPKFSEDGRWFKPPLSPECGSIPPVTAPAIIKESLSRSRHPRPNWIEVDVVAQQREISLLLRIYYHGLVAALEQMTAQSMPAVEAHCPRRLEPSHAAYQVCFRRLQQQMVMIVHQHPGMDTPTRSPAHFTQGFKKSCAISIVAENLLLAIPPVHHVIDRPFKFDSCFSCHRIHLLPRFSLCCLSQIFTIHRLTPLAPQTAEHPKERSRQGLESPKSPMQFCAQARNSGLLEMRL